MKAGLAIFVTLLSVAPGYADSGVGPNGINATGLKLPNGMDLTGAGIAIGQVEGARPGKPIANGGPDDAANSASAVVPFQVYMGTSVANTNGFRVLEHPEQVASVMISTNNMAPGVSPEAMLHAGGYAVTTIGQRDVALTMNRIASVNNSEVSAINFSENLALDGGEGIDGSSHLSRFVDWSAVKDDVLYVVAGREDGAGDGPVPTDNFNGITVAKSSNVGSSRFESVDTGNVYTEDAFGDRVSIDLLAPGVLIDVVNLDDSVTEESGTSLAAPHVVGAVALLQQYAKHQIDNSVARWVPPNARRHEVMKAILLNSADKLLFVHNSDRQIINLNGQRWDQAPAHSSPAIPLDENFGAGHLNVGNALTNFEPGEYDPGPVPLLGWDYGSIGGQGFSLDYTFDSTTSGWIAATLIWDRVVQLTDPDNTYNSGDEFISNPISTELTNLDLLLLDSNDNVISSSTASADSVEHIFFDVGETSGNYKIRVVNSGGGSGEGQDYALAWWAGEIESPTTPGDFNSDTSVDGKDFLAWQRGESPTPFSSSDLMDWQNNYGSGSLAASSAGPGSIAPAPLSPTIENDIGSPEAMTSGIGGSFSLRIKEASTGPEDVGTLEIVYTGDEENYAFANGGISLELASSDPGVIEFSDARILNDDNRWTWTESPTVGLDMIEGLEAFSVLSAGLAGTGTRVFAEIDYYLIGQGSTELQLLLSGLDPLVDGAYGDVSQLVDLVGMWLGDGQSSITAVPEPGGMLLAVQLAWLFAARRSGRKTTAIAEAL